jgi:hypothetical protein
MLAGWHAAEGARLAHLEATQAHAVAQYAHQVEALTMKLARMHDDLAAARTEIARLKAALQAAGGYTFDGPEDETP